MHNRCNTDLRRRGPADSGRAQSDTDLDRPSEGGRCSAQDDDPEPFAIRDTLNHCHRYGYCHQHQHQHQHDHPHLHPVHHGHCESHPHASRANDHAH
jgi:hypothetical protein